MTSAKDEFKKTVSYIKYDLERATAGLNNAKQSLAYFTSLNPQLRTSNNIGLQEVLGDIKHYNLLITKYNNELKDMERSGNLSRADIAAVQPATAAQLAADELQDAKEAIREAKKYDSKALWEKVRAFDIARETNMPEFTWE